MIVNLYFLSIQSNGMGAELNYAVVKDFCSREDLEPIEIWEILKDIQNKVMR